MKTKPFFLYNNCPGNWCTNTHKTPKGPHTKALQRGSGPGSSPHTLQWCHHHRYSGHGCRQGSPLTGHKGGQCQRPSGMEERNTNSRWITRKLVPRRRGQQTPGSSLGVREASSFLGSSGQLWAPWDSCCHPCQPLTRNPNHTKSNLYSSPPCHLKKPNTGIRGSQVNPASDVFAKDSFK